jgi:hypothetical protein
MDWFPIVFGTLKGLVLITGMFFAIKWHYDQGKKGKVREMRSVLRVAGMVTALFMLALVGLVFVTFALGRRLGMDLSFS